MPLQEDFVSKVSVKTTLKKVFILEPLDRCMRRMDFLSHKVTTDL